MGNFIGVCAKQEYELKIEQLSIRIKSLNCTLKRSQEQNIELKQELLTTNVQIGILEKKSKRLSDNLNHYNEILGNASSVADSIINSDLNCQWMNDEKEKEYLINIVEFIHLSCNDLTYVFNVTPIIKKKSESQNKKNRPPNKRPELIKYDTIDRLLKELNKKSNDTISSSSSISD